MSRTLRRAGALSLSTVLATAVLAVAPAAVHADDADEVLLIAVASSDAAVVADLDVVDRDGENIIVLGDASTERLLTDRGVAPVSVAPYAAASSAAARLTVRAAVGYPLPARIADREYETYFGGYRTQAAFDAYARDLAEAYPETVQLVDFGDSWLKTQDRGGSDLLALRITADVQDAGAYDDGQAGKPRFTLVAQAHAREIITSEIAWRYAAELLDGYGTDPQVTSLLQSTEVWINFRNNPDGASIVQEALSDPQVRLTAAGDGNPVTSSKAWQRKNLNDTLFTPTSTNWSSQQPGVDLNRNFGFHWGEASTSTDPRAATYRGAARFSEPETADLAELLTGLYGEFAAENDSPAPADRAGTYLNLHSYSNYVIYPYAYSATANVPNLEPIKANAFRQSYVNGFTTGKAGEILYDNSGNDIDWVYSQLGIPAFTWEIGTAAQGGFFPAFSRAADYYERTAPGIRFAAEAAYEPYTASSGGVIEDVVVERATDGSLSVSGTATDEAYGDESSSRTRRPAVTDITAVQAVLAADRTTLDEARAVSLPIAAAASTTTFAGTIPVDRSTAAEQAVFVRARNGSEQWGPWRAADADAVDSPVYEGESRYLITAGDELDLALPVDSSVAPRFTLAEGRLPIGVSLSDTGVVSGSVSAAGSSAVVVRIDNGAGAIDVPIAFDVAAGELGRFELSSSIADPKQGDTITVTAHGVDDFGNPLGDYSDRVSITSSVATDIIDGNRVTFPTASPHTLTVSFGGVSTSLLVEVAALPAPVPTPVPTQVPAPVVAPVDGGTPAPAAALAATGADPTGWVVGGALLLAAGTVLLVRRVRRD